MINPPSTTTCCGASPKFALTRSTAVRGYDYRDIGPKSYQYWGADKKEPVGGRLRLVDNVEMKYKVTDILRLYGFVDAGGVWSSMGDFDPGDMKFSAGIGLGVDIPRMGPVRIDYGIPINPDKDQGSGRLHLTTGFTF